MNGRIQGVQETEYKGRIFRSKLEAQTAETLDKLGIPYAYEERKIELIEGFRSPFQKDKVRSITYKPDFEIGSIIIECKGFETPEWKIKKKLLFKWLQENEPFTVFYQTHDAQKDVLNALDNHWSYLGFYIETSSKESRNHPSVTQRFESVREAMAELKLKNKAIGPILRVLIGDKEYAYKYNWKLKKVTNNGH